MCPPYTLGVSGDFCIRSPEWKFLYTLCIRMRVDARIRNFFYTLTSQYQHQSFSVRDFQESCEFGAKVIADSAFFVMRMLRWLILWDVRFDTIRIRYVWTQIFCIRIKKFAVTKISGYVWTGLKTSSSSSVSSIFVKCGHKLFFPRVNNWNEKQGKERGTGCFQSSKTNFVSTKARTKTKYQTSLGQNSYSSSDG